MRLKKFICDNTADANRIMATGFQIPRPLDLAGLLCGLMSLVLHVVGMVTPVWWVVHENDEQYMDWTFTYGIWVIEDCKNYTCITTSSEMHGDRAWLAGPATLLVFAVVLLLGSVLLSASHFRSNSHQTLVRKAGVLLCGGAGSVIILAVLIFYKKKAGLRPSAAPETTDGDPGWSLFLSTFGAVAAIINGVILGVSARKYTAKSLDKRRTVFGIYAQELEIDVNALRRGELVQGKRINMTSDESFTTPSRRPSSSSLDKRVNSFPSLSRVNSDISIVSKDNTRI